VLTRAAVERWVEREPEGPAADVALLDPPYATSGDTLTAVITRLVSGRHLAAGAVVVLESDRPWERLGPLVPTDVRRYGSTTLVVAEVG
jgi:16S rRNA G966 N2-methylase RsmD